MVKRMGRWPALGAAGFLLLGLVLASCTGQPGTSDYPELSGAHLEVVGDWAGEEQLQFERVLQGFTERTGARVTYTSAALHGVGATVNAHLAAGHPPDVALLPQPGLLRQYAASGRLVPLDAETVRVVNRDYTPIWRLLASNDGRLYGVWFKAANKSLLWYNLRSFERAGIAPPQNLGQLLATASTLRSAGIVPFSVGARDQWTLTDWFENLYLQLSGPQAYDQLASHRLAWTDPSVLRTLSLMSQLLAPQNLLGGVAGALHTGFEDSVQRAFASPPGAAMVMEGDFVAGAVFSQHSARIGVDVDAVPFPSARPGLPAIVGGGDVAVQFRATRAASELMRYLASPDAAAIWARVGGFISANLDLDLAVYPDELTRSIARHLIEAGDGFRFDLSDLQPAAFGSTENSGMQLALTDLLRDHDVAAAAERLERLAAVAYAHRSK
jgi:alpha-glucoside transport system substrate-binding protein